MLFWPDVEASLFMTILGRALATVWYLTLCRATCTYVNPSSPTLSSSRAACVDQAAPQRALQLHACSQGGVLAGALLGLIYVFQEKLVGAQYSWAACSLQPPCAAPSTLGLHTEHDCGLRPVPGVQIYIPRIPGVPNTFPYLPDKFGLEYEVRAARFRLCCAVRYCAGAWLAALAAGAGGCSSDQLLTLCKRLKAVAPVDLGSLQHDSP